MENRRFKIRIAKNARHQIVESAKYIAQRSQNLDTAVRFLERFEELSESLATFPERNPLVDFPHLKGKKIHRVIINNFNVYYTVNNKKFTVYVIAVIYGRREQSEALREVPSAI